MVIIFDYSYVCLQVSEPAEYYHNRVIWSADVDVSLMVSPGIIPFVESLGNLESIVNKKGYRIHFCNNFIFFVNMQFLQF